MTHLLIAAAAVLGLYAIRRSARARREANVLRYARLIG
jgi:hypothetical protein